MSSDNQLRLALEAGKTSSSLVGMIDPVVPQEFQSLGQNTIIPKENYEIKNYTKINLTGINPLLTTGIPTAFATNPNNAYFEFQYPVTNGPITRAELQFTFTVGAGGVTLLPTYLWLTKMEIYGNNNNSLQLETYSNSNEVALDLLLSLDNFNALESFCSAHNTNTSFANLALTAGTYTRSLSLNSSFISAMRPITATVDSPITVRIYMDSWANIATAGVVTDAVMSNIQMLVSYDQYPNAMSLRLQDVIRSSQVVTSFISPISNYVNNVPITFVSGTQQTFPLTALSDGLIAGMIIYLSSTTASAAAKSNVNMDGFIFQMNDGSGNTITQPVTGSFLNYDNVMERGNVALFKPSQTMKMYGLMFYGSDQKIQNGSVDGAFYLKQSMRLLVTPNSSGGPYNLWCVPLYYSRATLNSGKISVAGQ